MTNEQRVFITAKSVVTPIGSTVQEFSERMFAGDSGIVDIRGRLVPEDFPVPYAGLLSLPNLPRPSDNLFQEELEIICEHLWNQLDPQSNQDLKLDSLFFCGPEHSADWGHFLFDRKFKPDFLISYILHKCKSHNVAINPEHAIGVDATCTTGNLLLGRAYRLIRSGRAQRILVGAVERRVRSWVLMPYVLLGAVCTSEFPDARASRPFDRSRNGFIKGEGGALLLLESERACEERSARPQAEVLGYGQTSDGWRLTDGREDLLSASQALHMALVSAGLKPNDIDYLNAHGTSTPMNDKLEWQLIQKVFATKLPPVSSLKSQIGHSNLACGLIEAVACVEMLIHQRLAPTINFQEADPGCRLDLVPNKARDARVDTIMSNSFGFGGGNSSLILGRRQV